MCKDHIHDKRILPLLPGEQISINAKDLHDDDVETVNKFIKMCRNIAQINKLRIELNDERKNKIA